MGTTSSIWSVLSANSESYAEFVIVPRIVPKASKQVGTWINTLDNQRASTDVPHFSRSLSANTSTNVL
jgi:hypothetical protein